MKSFHKSLIHMGGGISYALSQWLILTFTARFLSLESAGIYSIYFALLTPASLFCSLGLRNSIASDTDSHFKDIEYRQTLYFGILLFSIYSLFVISIVKTNTLIGILVFSIKLIDLFPIVIYGKWVRDNVAQKCGISRILKLFLFLVFFLIIYTFSKNAYYIIFSLPISMLVVFILYDAKNSFKKNKYKKIELNKIKSIIKISLPLAFGSLLISLNTSVPRLIINQILNEEAVALYTLLIYFTSFALIPINSISQILIPYFSKNKNKDYFLLIIIKIYKYLALYSLLFIISMNLFAQNFSEIFYKITYTYSYLELNLVAIIGALQFITTIGNCILIGQRKFEITFHNNALSLISLIFFIYPLTYYFHLTGTYYGTLISCLIIAISMHYQIYKIYKTK